MNIGPWVVGKTKLIYSGTSFQKKVRFLRSIQWKMHSICQASVSLKSDGIVPKAFDKIYRTLFITFERSILPHQTDGLSIM